MASDRARFNVVLGPALHSKPAYGTGTADADRIRSLMGPANGFLRSSWCTLVIANDNSQGQLVVACQVELGEEKSLETTCTRTAKEDQQTAHLTTNAMVSRFEATVDV
jgi:hypothetical protein